MRCVCILVILAVIFTYAVALQEKSSSKQAGIVDATDEDNYEDDEDGDDYDYSVEDKNALKKHKHKKKLFLLAGGLKSLAVFIAIKIKIILIVVTVIGIIGFTLKVFGALKYAGYIGGVECPVVHEPAYGLGYSATPPPEHVHDYSAPYGSSNNDWSTTGSYARSLVENYIDTDFITHALKNMDMAEMIFTTLDMEDDNCRRRLVCEIDAKTRKLPYFDYMMSYFSRGFEKYRTPGEKQYKECAKLYPECEDSQKESRRRRRRTVEEE